MPTKEFDEVRELMQRMMNDIFRNVRPLLYQPERIFHPPMDVYETADALIVMMEISGMRPERTKVVMEKDLLSISGMRAEPSISSLIHLHQIEIDYGTFSRTLRIPLPVKADEIKATYRDGFLMITVPKRKETAAKIVEVTHEG